MDIKSQLYSYYLDLLNEISSYSSQTNISIDNKNLDYQNLSISDIIQNIKQSTSDLINYKVSHVTSLNNTNKNYYQLQNYTKKIEFDLKYYLRLCFEYKIQNDALEDKIRIYRIMQEDFEELKEKVKYESGRFLTNERKENEIIILRQENSILKKEIKKYKENIDLLQLKMKLGQETTTELKKQISSLTKKLSKLEKENIKNPNNNNSSINININNNGNSSSKLVIKHENHENNTNNNSLIPNTNSGSHFSLRKRRVNNLTKNYRKNNTNMGYTTTNNFKYQINPKFNNIEKISHNGFQTKIHKSQSRYKNSIENISNAFTATYTKILSNLYCKNKSPNKREKKVLKKNFSTICVDDYEKTIIKNINKSVKNKSSIKNKNNSYNKIIEFQNPKFPLTCKNQMNKKYSSSLPKTNKAREKSLGTYSSMIINKKI